VAGSYDVPAEARAFRVCVRVVGFASWRELFVDARMRDGLPVEARAFLS